MTTAIYTRVSPGARQVAGVKQTEQAISLDSQEHRCRSLAHAHEVPDARIRVYRDEFETSKTLMRPAMQKMIQAVEDGDVDAVYVLRLDRLTGSGRDLYELLDLFEKHNTRLVSVTENIDTETPVGRLVIKILTNVREMMLEQNVERTKEVLDYMKNIEGKAVGMPAFGMATDPPFGEEVPPGKSRKLVPSREEQEVLNSALRYLIYEGRGYAATAKALNEDGMTTRMGNPWSRQSVWHMMQGVDVPGLRGLNKERPEGR